jgi:peptidoglycan/LPS O-acetylase OafA/YrhL
VAILPPVLLYYVNWLQAFGHEIQALPHFWSLSTEEQFYLLWPLALSGLVRLGHRSGAAVIGCLILAFAAARALAPDRGPVAAALFGYYSTFARADELLVGALLAVLHGSPDLRTREVTARAARLLVWPAAVGLVACVIWARVYGDWMLRGGFTGIAAASGIIVVHCASGESTRLNRFLQTPALVAIGKRAYGIYVFHYPIIHALEPLRSHGAANWVIVTALRAAATLAVAWASYNLIESRFLVPRALHSYSLSSTRT